MSTSACTAEGIEELFKIIGRKVLDPNYSVEDNSAPKKPSELGINNNQNNKSLIKEINRLKKELIKANKIIEQQNLTINTLQNKINNITTTINNYQNIINEKDIQINTLNTLTLQLNNLQLNNNNINNASNNIHSSDKFSLNEIILVCFTSSDQNVHYAIPAVKQDKFAEIEEKLYQQYPQYRNTNNNFIANGREVLRFKTIGENNIGTGLPITLIVPA